MTSSQDNLAGNYNFGPNPSSQLLWDFPQMGFLVRRLHVRNLTTKITLGPHIQSATNSTNSLAQSLTGGLTRTSQTLASINHPANDITTILPILAKADHRLLMQSGNLIYMALHEELTAAKIELGVQK